MPNSVLENLRAARANYAEQLASISDPARRKVTYSLGGRSVSWTDYQRFLLEALREIDDRLAASDSVEVISTVE